MHAFLDALSQLNMTGPYRPAHRPFLLVVFLLSLAVFGLPGMAQTVDTGLLADATGRTAQAAAFQFDFDLDLTVSGVPGSDMTVDLQGSGILDRAQATPALDLTLAGSTSTAEGTVPANVGLRIVNDVLYIGMEGTNRWMGTPMSEIAPVVQNVALANYRSGFNEGLGAEPDLTLSGIDDPAVGEALSSIQAALASIDLSKYADIARLPDETVNGESMARFSTTVRIADLLAGNEAINLLVGLYQLGDPGATASFSAAELGAIGTLISRAFANTTLTIEQYVDLNTSYLRRSVIRFDAQLDPSIMGQTGSPVNLNLLFDVRLSDFDSGLTVTVPQNAMVINNLAEMMGVSTATNLPLSSNPNANPNTNSNAVNEALPQVTPPPTTTPNAVTTPVETIAIEPNTPTVVVLSSAGPTDLIYTAQDNETVNVVARSLEEPGTVDTTLEVLTSNGTRLNFNDDHGGTRSNLQPFDSAIEQLNLGAAGRYTIRVTTFTGAAEGQVEVTVESPLRGPSIGSATAVPTATDAKPGAPTPTPSVSTGGPIPTTTERGTVPERSMYTQTFTGSAGQQVTLTVRAVAGSDLDPKVMLLGPDGAVIAENDDHEDVDPTLSAFDSRLSNVTLPANGTYTIQISGFAGTGGDFELTSDVFGGGGELTPPAATPEVGPGQEQQVPGSVRQGETFAYDLTANAGDVFTFTVVGVGDFDPNIVIFDPNGTVVAYNDDVGNNHAPLSFTDAQLANLIFQESATYSIEIRGYQGSGGDFDMTITPVATGAPTGPGEEDVQTGSITAGSIYTTTVTLEAGNWVTISVRGLSANMDPKVRLLGPTGTIVAENDDHSSEDANLGALDSLIRNVRVEATGDYTIEVSGYHDSAGSFALVITTLR